MLSPSSSPLIRALQYIGIVILVAVASATAFSLWSPSSLLPARVMQEISLAMATRVGGNSTPAPVTPTRRPLPLIGIVAGHSGPQNDPGAVCPDGLTEASVNLNAANKTKDILEKAGFRIDLLNEFDDRLAGYKALAMISIHSDSCAYINNLATGFKVASALYSPIPDRSAKLTACITNRYGKRTGMSFHAGSITRDMTVYHAFNELDPTTPAAIIEVGFLNLDRTILTNHTDLIAQGIAEGVLCFVRNEPVP